MTCDNPGRHTSPLQSINISEVTNFSVWLIFGPVIRTTLVVVVPGSTRRPLGVVQTYVGVTEGSGQIENLNCRFLLPTKRQICQGHKVFIQVLQLGFELWRYHDEHD